jgi:hypothetical protein
VDCSTVVGFLPRLKPWVSASKLYDLASIVVEFVGVDPIGSDREGDQVA